MDWLIKLLGGVPRRAHERHVRMVEGGYRMQLEAIVDKHNMQSAWEQLKHERKMRRVH